MLGNNDCGQQKPMVEINRDVNSFKEQEGVNKINFKKGDDLVEEKNDINSQDNKNIIREEKKLEKKQEENLNEINFKKPDDLIREEKYEEKRNFEQKKNIVDGSLEKLGDDLKKISNDSFNENRINVEKKSVEEKNQEEKSNFEQNNNIIEVRRQHNNAENIANILENYDVEDIPNFYNDDNFYGFNNIGDDSENNVNDLIRDLEAAIDSDEGYISRMLTDSIILNKNYINSNTELSEFITPEQIDQLVVKDVERLKEFLNDYMEDRKKLEAIKKNLEEDIEFLLTKINDSTIDFKDIISKKVEQKPFETVMPLEKELTEDVDIFKNYKEWFESNKKGLAKKDVYDLSAPARHIFYRLTKIINELEIDAEKELDALKDFRNGYMQKGCDSFTNIIKTNFFLYSKYTEKYYNQYEVYLLDVFKLVYDIKELIFKKDALKMKAYINNHLFKNNPKLKSLFFPFSQGKTREGFVIRRNDETKKIDYCLYNMKNNNVTNLQKGLYEKGLNRLFKNNEFLFLKEFDAYFLVPFREEYVVEEYDRKEEERSGKDSLNSRILVDESWETDYPFLGVKFLDVRNFGFGFGFFNQQLKEDFENLKIVKLQKPGEGDKTTSIANVPPCFLGCESGQLYVNAKYLSSDKFFSLLKKVMEKIYKKSVDSKNVEQQQKDFLKDGKIFKLSLTSKDILLGWAVKNILYESAILDYADFVEDVCYYDKKFIWFDEKTLESGTGKKYKFLIDDEQFDDNLKFIKDAEKTSYFEAKLKEHENCNKIDEKKCCIAAFYNEMKRYKAYNWYDTWDFAFLDSLKEEAGDVYDYLFQKIEALKTPERLQCDSEIARDDNGKIYLTDDYMSPTEILKCDSEIARNVIIDVFSKYPNLDSLVFPHSTFDIPKLSKKKLNGVFVIYKDERIKSDKLKDKLKCFSHFFPKLLDKGFKDEDFIVKKEFKLDEFDIFGTVLGYGCNRIRSRIGSIPLDGEIANDKTLDSASSIIYSINNPLEEYRRFIEKKQKEDLNFSAFKPCLKKYSNVYKFLSDRLEKKDFKDEADYRNLFLDLFKKFDELQNIIVGVDEEKNVMEMVYEKNGRVKSYVANLKNGLRVAEMSLKNLSKSKILNFIKDLKIFEK